VSIREVIFKSSVVAVVLSVTAASAHYVAAHFKNSAAPLHPQVVPVSPRVVVLNGVPTTTDPPMTSTYVS
jgi:hypothetical protein